MTTSPKLFDESEAARDAGGLIIIALTTKLVSASSNESAVELIACWPEAAVALAHKLLKAAR